MSYHRAAVQDMKPLDAVEYLLRVIEGGTNLTLAIQNSGFTVTGARILSLLHARKGVPCPESDIYDAIYCDAAAEEMPEIGIVKSFIYQIRKKLPDNMKLVHIKRAGYVLQIADGTRAPWDAA